MAHMSMAGWSIRPVCPVCHGFTRVTCFFASFNELFINDDISGLAIAPIGPQNPAIANHGLSHIFAGLEEMPLNFNTLEVERKSQLRQAVLQRNACLLLRSCGSLLNNV